ncbi:MAG: PadR family transcriptional regulator [Gammaproteobacteria bacterium]|nr:PadR family transcriptional regulator [Gammaproteobacteria bacterium]
MATTSAKRATFLGLFELLILLAIRQYGANAPVPRIQCKLKTKTSRKVHSGSLHTTLERMKKNRLISISRRNPPASEGGPKRLFVSLTKSGQQTLNTAADDLIQLGLCDHDTSE